MNDKLPIPPLPPPHAPATINYDEAAIPPYETPDVLRFADGRPVALEDWPERRREMLDILASEMYGREPPPPEAFEWGRISTGSCCFPTGRPE